MPNQKEKNGNILNVMFGSTFAALSGRVPLALANIVDFAKQVIDDPSGEFLRYNLDGILPNAFREITNPFNTLNRLAQDTQISDLLKYGPDWNLISASLESLTLIALPLVMDTAIHGLSEKQDVVIDFGATRVKSALGKLDQGLAENLGIHTRIEDLVDQEKIKSVSHKILDVWEKPWQESTSGKERAKKWLIRTPIDGFLAVATLATIAHKQLECVGHLCG